MRFMLLAFAIFSGCAFVLEKDSNLLGKVVLLSGVILFSYYYTVKCSEAEE